MIKGMCFWNISMTRSVCPAYFWLEDPVAFSVMFCGGNHFTDSRSIDLNATTVYSLREYVYYVIKKTWFSDVSMIS